MCSWSSNSELFQLQIGTCHLPLQKLNHVLLHVLTFTFRVKSLGWGVEMRHFALGKIHRFISFVTDIFITGFMSPILASACI